MTISINNLNIIPLAQLKPDNIAIPVASTAPTILNIDNRQQQEFHIQTNQHLQQQQHMQLTSNQQPYHHQSFNTTAPASTATPSSSSSSVSNNHSSLLTTSLLPRSTENWLGNYPTPGAISACEHCFKFKLH